MLCLLAATLPLWWIGLYTSEAFRATFVRPDDWSRLRPFLFADIGLTVATAWAGVNRLRGVPSTLAGGVTIGAWGYATLWTVGASWAGALSALGTMLMLGAFVMVVAACHALVSPGVARDR
jgi:hypothetical protein